MTELWCTYEGTVPPEEIDHLGHMNVHFYATKASSATHALAREYGLSQEACEAQGVLLRVPRTFTRHYREQMVGAPLAVMTGVLSVSERGLRLYHELVNRDSGDLAATFVHDVELQDRETRHARSFPAGLAERAQASIVEWPLHGRPRSVDLDGLPKQLTLEIARERGLEMRKPRSIEATSCDEQGFFNVAQGHELIWGGEPITPRDFKALHETSDGRRFGWATLESRFAMLETPRVGTRIQSFSAEVAIARKTSYRHSWVFDLDSAAMIFVSSSVNLAFDIDRRKSIDISSEMREALGSGYHPDLA